MSTFALLFLAYFVSEVVRAMQSERKAIELIGTLPSNRPVEPKNIIMLLEFAQHDRRRTMLLESDVVLLRLFIFTYLWLTRYEMGERAAQKLIYRLHHKSVLRLDNGSQYFYLK